MVPTYFLIALFLDVQIQTSHLSYFALGILPLLRLKHRNGPKFKNYENSANYSVASLLVTAKHLWHLNWRHFFRLCRVYFHLLLHSFRTKFKKCRYIRIREGHVTSWSIIFSHDDLFSVSQNAIHGYSYKPCPNACRRLFRRPARPRCSAGWPSPGRNRSGCHFRGPRAVLTSGRNDIVLKNCLRLK